MLQLQEFSASRGQPAGADGWVAAVKGKAPRGRSVVLLLRAWLPCLVLFKLRSRPTALQGKRWR